MKIIPLTQGYETIVDDDDYERFGQYIWQANNAGCGKIYARRTEKNTSGKTVSFYLHREIMNAQKGEEVDHVHGNTMDNQKCHLRIANRHQNTANRGKNRSKSGFKGVYPQSRSVRWVTKLQAQGMTIHIGTFNTPEEAAREYDKHARIHFGEFAHLNFPEH